MRIRATITVCFFMLISVKMSGQVTVTGLTCIISDDKVQFTGIKQQKVNFKAADNDFTLHLKGVKKETIEDILKNSSIVIETSGHPAETKPLNTIQDGIQAQNNTTDKKYADFIITEGDTKVFSIDLTNTIIAKTNIAVASIIIVGGGHKDTVVFTASGSDPDTVADPGTGTNKKWPGGYLFIPSDSLEVKWVRNNYYTTQPIPPLLNKHTRWALLYDFTKQDPVAVYKRTNKVAGNTCDETVVTNKPKDKKSKSLPEVAKQIYELSKVLDSLLKTQTDELGKQLLGKVKQSTDSLKVALLKQGNDSKKVIAKIEELKIQLESIKALYPDSFPQAVKGNIVGQPVINRSLLSTSCCEKIYCIQESRRLAPTVGRNLLISVNNYHPYRDSFALAVGFNDRFLENAAVFTSAFAGTRGAQGTPLPADAAGKKITEGGQQVAGAKEEKKFDLFTQLRNELKGYYTEKFQQEQLNVQIVANGVEYIKQRLADTALLGVTDLTSNGIIKRAEELADKHKQENAAITLEAYFAMAREAAAWFSKISNYKVFDSKSILIQNKDEVTITFNRYVNGVLQTSAGEAVRSYTTESGFKIDFSLGIFGSGLIDKKYTTVPQVELDTAYFKLPNGTLSDSIIAVDSVDRRRIIRDGLGNFDIGPAIFAHGYWRSGTDINISGTFGFSINQSAMPRFLLGGSILFGKNSRWIGSIGGVWGKIKELASGYELGKVIPVPTSGSSDLPTKDVWKASWFVSVSWNFGGFTVGNNP